MVGNKEADAVTLRARCKRLYQRLRADACKGSTAIEFAMVAPIFFVLLMGTIEAGVISFGQSPRSGRATASRSTRR